MKALPSPRVARVLLALAVAVPAFWGPAPAKERTFQAVLRLRHPDGHQESVEVSNLRFVYYDRRFVHHSAGFGKRAVLEIRDLPREVRSLQSDDLHRVKFSKIRKVAFEYREEEGKRVLHLVITRTSRRRKPVDWPGLFLRNASSALPHFRGVVGGVPTDFPLPPIVESDAPDRTVLTEIDFLIPGAGSHP